MTEEEILKKFDDIEQEIITMRNHDKLLLEACTELIQKIKSMKTPATNLCVFLTVVCSTVAPGIGTVASWLVGTVVFDLILGVIIDEFSYNNCIKVFPLMYKGEPFISNTYGQTNLIPGITENSDKDGNGVKIPDEQTDKENELNKTLG